MINTRQICEWCHHEFYSARRTRYCSAQCRRCGVKDAYNQANRRDGPPMPTPTVGAMHELLVCADLLRRGYHVFRAMSPACPCDLALLGGGRLIRVEVTTGHRSVAGTLQHAPKNRALFEVLAIVEHGGVITYDPEMPNVVPPTPKD